MIRRPIFDWSISPASFSGAHYKVYCAIGRFSNSDGEAWPNLKTISQVSGVTTRYLKESLAWLVANGWLVPSTKHTKGGDAIKSWVISEIDSETGLPVKPKPQEPQPQPDPEPKPKMPRAERAKLMYAQMAAMTPEEFDAQMDWEWVNADLGETQFLDDPAQFLDDPEPQPAPNPKPKTKPQPKPKTKPKPKPETEIPAELLAVDGFAAAWADWLTYRKQAKLQALTPIALTRQFSAMVTAASGGVDVVACINKAITSNWQGIHLDTQTKPQPQPQAKSAQKALYEEVLVDYYDSIGALDDNGELLPPWETNPKKGKAKSSPKPALVLTNTDDADLPF